MAINKEGKIVKLASNAGECSECDVLVVLDSFYMYKPDNPNPPSTGNFNNAAVDLTPQNPTNAPNYPNFGHSVGLYGNKIWALDSLGQGIFEWEIDYNRCLARHINTYYTNVGGGFAGACMKDANTFLVGSTYIWEIDVSNPSPTLPNLTPVLLFNLPSGLQVMGDISYVASTGTILAFLRPLGNAPGSWLFHFDYSGNVLGSVAFHLPTSGSWSLFHYKGKEYFAELYSGDIYEITFNPLSYNLTTLYEIPHGCADTASSPKPAPCPPPLQTSWDCVQIGDHPKFGYKCVEIQGTGGQYGNKQDCLRSGCEGINPDPGMPVGPGFPSTGGPSTGPLGGGTTGGGTGGASASPLPKPPSYSEGEK